MSKGAKMRSARREQVKFLCLCLVGVGTLAAITWAAISSIQTAAVTAIATVHVSDAQRMATGLPRLAAQSQTELPSALRKLKEDRDAELRLAHLELSDKAASLSESLRGFEDEISEWGGEFHHYIQVSPTIAALGQQMEKPAEVKVAKNVASIRSSSRVLRHAKREYELSIERIKLAYSQKLAAIESPSGQKLKIEDPKTEFQEDVLFALWLDDRLDDVVASLEMRVNAYRQLAFGQARPELPNVMATWQIEFFKSRGQAASATDMERKRATALGKLDDFSGALAQFDSDPLSKNIKEVVASLHALLLAGSAKIDKGDFDGALETLDSAATHLAEARQLRIRRSAQAEYQLELQRTPANLWNEHGGDAWDQIRRIVSEANSQVEAVRAKDLYEDARKLASEKHVPIRLAAANAADVAGKTSVAFELVGDALILNRIAVEPNNTYNQLAEKHPEYFLELASQELERVSIPEDYFICCHAIECGYREIDRELPESVMKGRLWDKAREVMWDRRNKRTPLVWWCICEFNLDGRHSTPSAIKFINTGVKVLQQRADKPFDDLRLIDLVAVYKGLALRANAVNEAKDLDKMFQALCGVHHRRVRNPSLQVSQELLQLHYDAISLVVSGKYDEAFSKANVDGLAHTWAIFAMCTAFDDGLLPRMDEIKKEFAARKAQHAFGLRKGFLDKMESDHDENLIKYVDPSDRATNGRSTLPGIGTWDDDINFCKVAAATASGDLPRRRGVNGVGLYVFSQVLGTKQRASVSDIRLYDLVAQGRELKNSAHVVGRYVGIAMACYERSQTAVSRSDKTGGP